MWVDATYHFLKAMISEVNAAPQELRVAVRAADQATAEAGASYSASKALPLTFGIGTKSESSSVFVL